MQNRNLDIVRRLTQKNVTKNGRITLSMVGLDKIMEAAREDAVNEYKRTEQSKMWSPHDPNAEAKIKKFRSKSFLDYLRL